MPKGKFSEDIDEIISRVQQQVNYLHVLPLSDIVCLLNFLMVIVFVFDFLFCLFCSVLCIQN